MIELKSKQRKFPRARTTEASKARRAELEHWPPRGREQGQSLYNWVGGSHAAQGGESGPWAWQEQEAGTDLGLIYCCLPRPLWIKG